MTTTRESSKAIEFRRARIAESDAIMAEYHKMSRKQIEEATLAFGMAHSYTYGRVFGNWGCQIKATLVSIIKHYSCNAWVTSYQIFKENKYKLRRGEHPTWLPSYYVILSPEHAKASGKRTMTMPEYRQFCAKYGLFAGDCERNGDTLGTRYNMYYNMDQLILDNGIPKYPHETVDVEAFLLHANKYYDAYRKRQEKEGNTAPTEVRPNVFEAEATEKTVTEAPELPAPAEKKPEPKHDEHKPEDPTGSSGFTPAPGVLHLEQGKAVLNLNCSACDNMSMTDFRHFLKAWPMTEEEKQYLSKYIVDKKKLALLKPSAKLNPTQKNIKPMTAFFRDPKNRCIVCRYYDLVYITDCYVVAQVETSAYNAVFVPAGYPQLLETQSMQREPKQKDWNPSGMSHETLEKILSQKTTGDAEFIGQTEADFENKTVTMETGCEKFHFAQKTYEFLKKMGADFTAVKLSGVTCLKGAGDGFYAFAFGIRTNY